MFLLEKKEIHKREIDEGKNKNSYLWLKGSWSGGFLKSKHGEGKGEQGGGWGGARDKNKQRKSQIFRQT